MGRDADILWRVASDLARRAAEVSQARPRTSVALPPLLFFTDPARTPRPWEVARRLPSGAGVVFRHFGASDAADTALRLREATRDAGGLLLIGADVELADRVGADGVHLPERKLATAGDLALARPGWILTGAWHGSQRVESHGLDALVLSPVFRAGGASAGRAPLGPSRFGELAKSAPCPVYALGGVTPDSARTLEDSGAAGLAAVDGIASAFER